MRRRALLLAAVLAALAAAPSAHAGGWLPLEPATASGAGAATNPRVAVDDAGNVYAVWILDTHVQASKRPVGGVFEPPQTLDIELVAANPDIAVDGAGNAVVVWRSGAGSHLIKHARRAAGDTAFGSPEEVPTTGTINETPRVAANGAGELVLAWSGGPNDNEGTRVSLATTTTPFPAVPSTYDEGTTAVGAPDVAINAAGDAVVIWQYTAGSATPIHATYRDRGTASFGAVAQDVTDVSTTNFDPHVAIDASGRAVALWGKGSTNVSIASATRGNGGSPWVGLDPLEGPATGNIEPHVDFDATGAAVGAWSLNGSLRSSVLPSGATQFMQPPQSPSPDPHESPFDLALDAGADGTIALLYASGAVGSVTRATVRPNGGAFGPITTLTPADHGGADTDVAVDPSGNAAAVWIDTNPPDKDPRVVNAIYDATPPKLGDVSAPLAVSVLNPFALSATASDDWSTPTVTWDFGDGSTDAGATTQHDYAQPGVYTVTATATDATGNSSQKSANVLALAPITPPPIPPPAQGESFNAEKIKGKVLVSVPKANAPKLRPAVAHSAAALTPPQGYTRFVPLEEQRHVPIGALIDATRGTVKMTMAVNRAGTLTQTGNLSKGAFKTSQRRASALTTLTMMSRDNFRRGCRSSRPRRLGTSSARKRPRRQLFSNVRGHFRTRGRHSTATVRGTQYLVKDTCSGTLTSVRRGVVVVQDLVKHRRRTLHAGQRYLAHPRKLG